MGFQSVEICSQVLERIGKQINVTKIFESNLYVFINICRSQFDSQDSFSRISIDSDNQPQAVIATNQAKKSNNIDREVQTENISEINNEPLSVFEPLLKYFNVKVESFNAEVFDFDNDLFYEKVKLLKESVLNNFSFKNDLILYKNSNCQTESISLENIEHLVKEKSCDVDFLKLVSLLQNYLADMLSEA